MPTTQETAVIEYLKRVTRGVIRCTPQVAREIIDLVNNTFTGYVIKKVYNSQHGNYEIHRTIHINVEDINAISVRAMDGKQYKGFYNYDCYQKDGTPICSFYSINGNLFENV
jgi:hypothetical protein